MSQLFNAIAEGNTIPSSSTFTSAEFDASNFTRARIDCNVTARATNSIRFRVYVAAKAGGDYTELKATGAISATGHTTLLLNGGVTAGEVLGWVKIVADTATDAGTGFKAIVDALFM